MTILTIYQKIKRIAKPVINAYHEDLTKWDRLSCASMQPGTVALWTCRDHGTHFVWVRHEDDDSDLQIRPVSSDYSSSASTLLESLRCRLNHFDAIADVFGNTDGASNWHLIECLGTKQHGTVTAVNASEAREILLRRVKGVESYIERKRAA